MYIFNPPVETVIIYESGVAVSHTGDTNEFTLATIPIVGGLLGPNGQLEIVPVWTVTNNANAKNLRVYFGTSLIYNIPLPNLQSQQLYLRIANRGLTNSQIVFGAGSGFQSTVNPISIYNVNTLLDQNIVITGQLGNAADTVALQSYIIKVYPKD
jgi:hypothetical protein